MALVNLRKPRPILLFRLAAALACLVLASCFDSHEEVWVAANGSARAELTYHVSSNALYAVDGGAEGLEKRIRDVVATLPELRLDELLITQAGGETTISGKFSTDSLLWLRDLKKNASFKGMPERARDLAGRFQFVLEGMNVNFTRTINAGDAVGMAGVLIGAEDRVNRHMVQIIHLPQPATESNATRSEDSGCTLVWDASLGDALRGPVVSHFRAPAPLPVWLMATAVGAVALVLAGGVLLVLKFSRRTQWKGSTRSRSVSP